MRQPPGAASLWNEVQQRSGVVVKHAARHWRLPPRASRCMQPPLGSFRSGSSSLRGPNMQLQQRPRAATAAAAAAALNSSSSEEQQQQRDEQEVQRRLLAHGVVADEREARLLAAQAAQAHHYLASQGALPPGVSCASELVARVLALADLMAAGGVLPALAMVKRHPGLLALPPDEVAQRVLQLKLLLPASDVGQLLYQKPSLLLLPDAPRAVGGALAQLRALMPGIPVEAKLHQGGTVFWSFASLLDGGSGGGGNSLARAGAQAAGHSGSSSIGGSSSSTGGSSIQRPESGAAVGDAGSSTVPAAGG